MDHQVEAAAVVEVASCCCGVSKPLLWDHLAFGTHRFSCYSRPGVFQWSCPAPQESSSWARCSVVAVGVYLSVAPWQASVAAPSASHRQWQS